MKIHEFQAKDLLRAAGVPALAGRVAPARPTRPPPRSTARCGHARLPRRARPRSTPAAAARGRCRAPTSGRRGTRQDVPMMRGGSAHRAPGQHARHDPDRARGAGGAAASSSRAAAAIERELDCAVLVDRPAWARPALIASTAGGVGIEEVRRQDARTHSSEPFDPDRGLAGYQARLLASKLKLPDGRLEAREDVLPQVWQGVRRSPCLAPRDQSARAHEGCLRSSPSTRR